MKQSSINLESATANINLDQDLSVGFHVKVNFISPRKGLFAEDTFVGFLASVYEHVPLQSTSLRERFVADVTISTFMAESSAETALEWQLQYRSPSLQTMAM
jgi:hypothetical protein